MRNAQKHVLVCVGKEGIGMGVEAERVRVVKFRLGLVTGLLIGPRPVSCLVGTEDIA